MANLDKNGIQIKEGDFLLFQGKKFIVKKLNNELVAYLDKTIYLSFRHYKSCEFLIIKNDSANFD